jgi:CMP-N,N'-diacetyllegionaminic acid synthase
MKILAIIPARGGSKGIKNKNIIDLNGQPLIYYTLNEAEKVDDLDRIIVSTESNVVKTVCDKIGNYVPSMRPVEFAQDHSRTIDLVEDIIMRLEKVNNETYDYICLLQPTSPLRIAKDIQECIEIIKEQGNGSVVSLAKIDEPHPYKMKIIEGGEVKPLIQGANSSIPRQELPEVFELNGAIYLTETIGLMKNRTFFCEPCVPFIMPMERSVNINNQFDLRLAEYLLNDKLK